MATNVIAHAASATQASAAPIAVTIGRCAASPREWLATPYIPSGKITTHTVAS
jgi:hypothetical protein